MWSLEGGVGLFHGVFRLLFLVGQIMEIGPLFCKGKGDANVNNSGQL